VTDLVLPGGMDGLQLARTLRRRHPRLPIVLISGYSPALAEHQGLSGAEFLPKPFRQKALGDAIRRAVQSARLLSVPSALSEIGYT
jgi:FixJ family two-component response regulator